MRILCVQIPCAKKDSPYFDYMQNVYGPALKRAFDSVLQRDDVEYTFRTCEWGLASLDVPIYEFADTVTRRATFYAAVNAQEEGFDAVFIDCMGDPMLDELRQVLDIPVVGMGESSVVMSVLMGRKFAFIMPSERECHTEPRQLFIYGQQANCTGMYAMPPGSDMLMGGALQDASEFLPIFEETCKKAVADGAEVILPGCCLISLACMQVPNAEGLYPGGLKTVDGAIVMDVVGSSVLTLENLVKLKEAGSPWISRKQLYISVPEEHKAAMANIMQAPDLTYWDVVC